MKKLIAFSALVLCVSLSRLYEFICRANFLCFTNCHRRLIRGTTKIAYPKINQ